MKNKLFIFIILMNIFSVYVMAEGRRDSFEIRNKRWTKISIEVEYVTPRDTKNFGWIALFTQNEHELTIHGHNHIDEGNPYVRGLSSKEIYHYIVGLGKIDDGSNLTLSEFIDTIPFIERLNSILKKLVIRDNKNKIILTLNDINDGMIKSNNGTYYIEIK